MGIEFLLAPVTADAEQELLRRVKESIGDDMLKPALVIVPPQATYATEQMLMDKLKLNGLIGVEVLSVARVAQRVLDEVMGMKGRTLSAAGKSMIIKDVLDSRAGELEQIGALAGHADLPLMLSDAITELKGFNVTPQDLTGISKDTNDPVTRQKFHDLSVLYEGYLNATENHDPPFIDSEDKLKFAAQVIRSARQKNDPALFLTDTDVFMYGFDVINARVADFLTEVMLSAPSTVISFYHAQAGSPDEAVYNLAYNSRAPFQKTAGGALNVTKIYEDADKPKEIIHLARHLFSDGYPDKIPSGAVSLAKAESMRMEVDGICAQIAALKQQGVDYRDMAVICGNTGEYLPLIKSRFKKANIPCFIGEKRGITENNLADFVLGAFDISRGRPRKNALAAHALTGYTALCDTDCKRFGNYIYENVKNGAALFKTEFLTRHKEYAPFIAPVTELRECAKGAKNGAQWIECVLEYINNLNVLKKVSDKASEMRKAGYLQEADYLEQSYLKITASLLEAAELCKDKSADNIIVQILKAGLAAQQISCIPQGSDEVLCAAYSAAWLPNVKVLFAIGANQGVMPNYEDAPAMISESDRQAILCGGEGGANEDSALRQKFALMKALSRPAEKLYISYVDNGELQPSSIVDRLFELFSDIGETTVDLKDAAPTLLQNAWELSAKRLRDAADGAPIDYDGLKYEAAALKSQATAESYRKLIKSLSQSAGELKINGDAAKKLYKNRKISPSSVETYYKCPYRHLLQYGIKAYKQQEAGVNVMNMGTYAHAIFNDIYTAAKNAGKTWRDYSPQEFETLVDGCIAKNNTQEYYYEPNTREGAMLDSIAAEVKEAAKAVHAQYNVEGHNLQQHMSEKKFDKYGVHGIIDRIDTAEVGGKKYFGIVDYKTGYKDFSLYKAAAGLDLQMLIYALAAYELLKDENKDNDYILAGINYMLITRFKAERGDGQPYEKFVDDVKAGNMKNYRMKGLITVPPDEAKELYGDTEESADLAGTKGLYSTNLNISKNGYNGNQANRFLSSDAANDEIGDLLKFVKLLLSEADGNINGGDAKKLPVSENAGECACRYCDYRSVCRYDPATVDDVRKIEKSDKHQVLENIRKRI